MAKFLNSSGTTYHLEELIKNASDRLIIISPYLKLNERIKELLEDRNRLKIDIIPNPKYIVSSTYDHTNT